MKQNKLRFLKLNNKYFSPVIFPAIAVVLLLGGCYSYPPAQVATEDNTFSQKKIDRYGKLLKGIKVLTLLTAQKIAVKNNPNYTSAYHAVNAAKMRYYQALGAYSPTVYANFTGGGSTHTYNQKSSSERHRIIIRLMPM